MLAQGATMDGPEGKQLQSVEEMIGRFTGELVAQISDWKQWLIDSPEDFEAIERQVHQVFARGGDMLTAGSLAVTISGGHVEQAAEHTRRSFSRPLAKGRERMIAVRLLGGMILWVTLLYCPPRKKRFRKNQQPRVGLDVTRAQFGFGQGLLAMRTHRIERLRDGELHSGDAIAEVVAMHLHRLGASKAQSVTFVADGAPWIWDRIASIIQLAGLEGVTTTEVLDCCHAVHHVSAALASLGLSKEERNPLYRHHRTLIRNGQWRHVVEQLSDLQRQDDPVAALETEISYLRRHGEAGRLSYVSFRSRGLPCGSGAIESSIRRVINLRLKSNAMFWKSENAESILQVRSQVVPGRWDAAMTELSAFKRTVAYDDYQWMP